MAFSAALKRLSASEREALNDLISEWEGSTEVPLRAAENLRRENAMSAKDLERYLRALAKSKDALKLSGIGPKVEFERIGKPFLLSGHVSTPFKRATFGRAVRIKTFAGFLKQELDKLRCFDTEEEIRGTLRSLGDMEELRAPSSQRVYFEAMRRTKLGREVLFATFVKPTRLNQRPWVTPVTATKIRSTCGLGEVPRGEDFILFVYSLPDFAPPHVPTTASPGWDYQWWFRPNPKASVELHGWTRPISRGFAKIPEVVHSEINGSTLLFPIHITIS